MCALEVCTREVDPMDSQALTRDCLERLAAGDLTARDQLIELCSERLRLLTHKLLARYPGVRRSDDTDDVFQDAIMRLHRALGDLAAKGESPRSLMALGAIQIHRQLLDLARRAASPMSYASNHGTNVFDAGGRPQHFVETAAAAEDEPLDSWERFHAAIEGLDPQAREVFRLVWYLGADQKTVAAVMACCERTVKTRWRQAREAVKAALEDECLG
jgi:RNA polymerase sigma factor (sigma-70 family)